MSEGGTVTQHSGPSGALKADSEYLGFEDMPVGRDVVVTITSALLLDSVPMQQGHKYSGGGLEFKEGRKNKMLLNSGNRKVLVRLYGSDTGAWQGQKIAIYGDPSVMFGRTNTGGIKIRDTASDKLTARAKEIVASPSDDSAGVCGKMCGDGPEPLDCVLPSGHDGDCGAHG